MKSDEEHGDPEDGRGVSRYVRVDLREGDEGHMVQKMRIGQLHAAALSTIGLHMITPEPQALDLPLIVDNYQERDYLLSKRKDAFVRQFCRKLLGYALARGVQLSDEPLLDDMQEQLKAHDYRVTTALAAIVRSPQFRDIRGVKFAAEE